MGIIKDEDGEMLGRWESGEDNSKISCNIWGTTEGGDVCVCVCVCRDN